MIGSCIFIPARRSSLTARCVSILAAALISTVGRADVDRGAPMASIAGAQFESVLPIAPKENRVRVKAFKLDRTPVTNAQFAAFVRANDEWRRDKVPKLFADARYLSHWPSHDAPAPNTARQPVTHVSWYAARAYCQARGARLPNWHEWEWAAAADAERADARQDPQWKQQMLSWYAQTTGEGLQDVGARAPNVYGVHDLHGLVWEWVEDYNGMLVSGDNRQQSEPDATRFCGPGALTMEQKENYAVLMRIAMLSSMQGRYTTAAMGFRCAR